MLLMVENGVKGRNCHAIYRYVKANKKYMKDYDKNKKSSDLKYWDVNNLYGGTVPQNLPEGGFKWVEETCQFNEDFLKSFNEDSDRGYFL